MPDHYDLLARPDWTATAVLIVTPYVEREFFERIMEDLQPETLAVVIDDGCRPEDVRMVRECAENLDNVAVVLGSAPGLVHSKIFHVELLTPGGTTRHTLVFGSANATRQAFNGMINAETLCRAQITAANHHGILGWLQAVRAASLDEDAKREIDAVQDGWVAQGVTIRLPAILIKEATTKASNFDLWLQRGRLLAKFDPDPSFLRVHVNLLRPLPPGDAQRRILSLGFEAALMKRLAIPYLGAIEGEQDGDAEAGNWRSRLFVWTNLGYWCSDECFDLWHEQFKKAGHEGRAANLERLALLHGAARDAARTRFIDQVGNLVQVFGDDAPLFLQYTDGALDREHYETIFDQRVDRDLALAADPEYVNRYINGCEINDVPRFRVDSASWRIFSASFFRQIHLESLKARSQSLAYHHMAWMPFEYAGKVNVEDATISSLVRERWNEMTTDDNGEAITVGDYIASYYNAFG